MKHHKFTLAVLLGLVLAFPVIAADTVDLPPGYRLTITADSTSAGSFWRLADTTASQGSPTAVTASSSDTAGPFQVSSIWAMDSTRGKLTTTQAPVHFTDAETIDGINGAELLLRDGSIPLTSNWDAGAFTFTGTRFISDIATGTAPFGASSTTKVANLNVDTLDDLDSAAYGQLATAQEYTKQHNFNATTLTALGADTVVNGNFTDGSDLVGNGDFTDGSDLVTNGSMTGDTDWIKGVGWTLPGTVADSDATQEADSDLTQALSLVENEVYSIVYTTANRTAGVAVSVCGDTEASDQNTNNTFTELVTCGAGGDIDIRADATWDGDVDNVSVKLVGDAGWTQGDGWLISTGSASSDASQSADSDLTKSLSLIENEVYSVVFTVSNFNLGTVTAVCGDTELTDRGSDATFTELVTCGAGGDFHIRASATFDGTVDDVTIALVGDAGWTQGTGWLISTGSASSSAAQGGDSDLEDDASVVVAGNTYEVTFTHTNFNAGTITPVVGGQEGTDRGSDATFTELIVATNTDVLKMRASATWDGTIDTITMKLANVSWDLDDNQVTGIVLDQNLAMDDPTNMVDGSVYTIHLIQDGTGTRIPTWDSAYLFEGGTVPTLTTTATTGHDIFRFISDGSSMYLISDTLDLQ